MSGDERRGASAADIFHSIHMKLFIVWRIFVFWGVGFFSFSFFFFL